MALFLSRKPKVCIVGLDGVPHRLLESYLADGTMPRTADLFRMGHLRPMKASLPEISSVSWSSFMTGTNPGTHGIFGFLHLKPGGYDITFPSFRDLKAPTIWDRLGERKKTSVVLNQPSTYPARPIPGVLVSGFVAIEMEKAVYPASVLRKLEEMGYRIDIDTSRAKTDKDFLFRDLADTLEKRKLACRFLMENTDWDLFEVVVTGTDRLHHFAWDALADPGHPYHKATRNFYRQVDELIAEVYEKYRKAARDERAGGVFALSDHGFAGIDKEFYLNSWLRDEGYLSYRKLEPEELSDLSGNSRAFALDPGRIFLNLKGKFTAGSVNPQEAGGLLDEIRRKLLALEYEGRPVVREVFRRDDIYKGPCTGMGPDLVVLTHKGFDVKSSVKQKQVFGRTQGLTGMHTWDDAFFWSAEPVENRDLAISDLAEMILARF
jgi:predicted AlkP superfamily phosphohydrolase/phosphomutase